MFARIENDSSPRDYILGKLHPLFTKELITRDEMHLEVQLDELL